MAKPNSRPPAAGPSSLSTTRPADRRRRRIAQQRSRSAPSSGIFALVATVWSTGVDGHPVDPSHTALPFLYPFIDTEPASPAHPRSDGFHILDDILPPPSDTPPVVTTPACLQERSNLPDKYVQGSDGLWRKTTEWSLYGSTDCSGSCSPTATSLPSDVNDQASPSSPPNSMTSSPTASLDDFDVSLLPTGWKVQSATSRDLTIVILVLSMALAGIILFMMVTCVAWRKKKGRTKDVEKIKKKLYLEDLDEGSAESIRQMEAKQKKWARATSRWKSNIRFSARRRRVSRLSSTSSTAVAPTHDEEEDRRTIPEEHETPPFSRALSPISLHPSLSSVDDNASPPLASERAPSPVLTEPGDRIEEPVSPTLFDTPSFPPAYRPSSPGPAPLPSHPSDSPIYQSTDGVTIPGSSKPPFHRAAMAGSSSQEHGEALEPASHAGHVATDDKALLARRAAMISAPPIDGAEFSLPFVASVPALEDDDLELPLDDPHLAPHAPDPDEEVRPPYSPPESGLPSPPSKGKMAAQYDYSYEFDGDLDIANVEPESGPSAPPFEESPSAPPFEAACVAPSAPPLEDDGVPAASAPPLEASEAAEIPVLGGRICHGEHTST
ncbi:hypothetical protein BV25DRAFT_1390753 [Artomyces pyxidatus]|uniref:Uncharacterized protein n=1 Tax=Artomyces pyxidatus TaxID=48021 RepID=A0ACB8TDJ0_9AGAM|nr:hypothetical protein BV25DRAFT_1390753 [Artomyces pyxidatus]